MTACWGYGEKLPRNGARDGEFVFVASEGDRAIDFFARRLWIAEGDYAGQHYIMPPWQDYYLRALYGWRRRVPTRIAAGAIVRAPQRLPRRYRRSLVAVSRGNLKSALASGIALKGLIADGVRVPVVVGAGTDRKNAAIIFGYSSYSAKRDPALRRRLEVLDGTKVIRKRHGNGSYTVIAASDTHSHGGHPTLEVLDDLQAQPRPNLIKVLRTAQITLSDSLFLALMTAGFEKSGVGWEEWERALAIEADPALDPAYLPALYYADEDADIEDPAVQRKANPSLGISIREEEIRDAVRTAKTSPNQRSEILTLNFNIWPGGKVASWIPADQWKATAGIVREELLGGRPCFAGVVATSNTDVSAVAYIFPPQIDGEGWQLVLDAFVPRDCLPALEAAAKVSFAPFIDDGWLTTTEGDLIDERAIVASVEQRRNMGWLIQRVAYNPRGTIGVMRGLQELGLEVVAVTPGFGTMSPAMHEFEKHVIGAQLHHSGDRLLAWQMRNLRAKHNGDGALAPDLEHSAGNVSGPIAALSALSLELAEAAAAVDQPKRKWGLA